MEIAKEVDSTETTAMPTPRPFVEIQTELRELAMRAGAIDYEIKHRKRQLENIFHKMEEVNSESIIRMNMDKEAQAELAAEGVKMDKSETTVQ